MVALQARTFLGAIPSSSRLLVPAALVLTTLLLEIILRSLDQNRRGGGCCRSRSRRQCRSGSARAGARAGSRGYRIVGGGDKGEGLKALFPERGDGGAARRRLATLARANRAPPRRAVAGRRDGHLGLEGGRNGARRLGPPLPAGLLACHWSGHSAYHSSSKSGAAAKAERPAARLCAQAVTNSPSCSSVPAASLGEDCVERHETSTKRGCFGYSRSVRGRRFSFFSSKPLHLFF